MVLVDAQDQYASIDSDMCHTWMPLAQLGACRLLSQIRRVEKKVVESTFGATFIMIVNNPGYLEVPLLQDPQSIQSTSL